MKISYRWACFALALVVGTVLLGITRFQYSACDTDGCVVVDRWTGTIRFRETENPYGPEPSGALVRSPAPRRGTAASPATVSVAADPRRGGRGRLLTAAPRPDRSRP